MSLDNPIREVLSDFADLMRSRNTGWYLLGAQAAIIWGRARSSLDVDVTAQIPLERAQDFVDAMKEEGFRLRVPDYSQFLRRTRTLPFVHARTSIPLDVIVAGPGLEEQFMERAITVERAGLTLPVIHPDDLVASKVLAGRPKDMEDAYGILVVRDEQLDIDRIRATLSWLETMLGRDDLIPSLEKLQKRTEESEE